MAFIVSGYSRQHDSVELIKFTRDEVFDTLEKIEDRLLADLKEYECQGYMPSYQYIKGVLLDFEKLWKLIQNSSIGEFYMLPSGKIDLDRGNSTVAFYAMQQELLYKCNLVIRTCKFVDTVEQGRLVSVTTETVEEPAYVALGIAEGVDTYVYDTRLNYERAVIEAEGFNRYNRIFKCKDCGKIAHIDRKDDAWKISKGLSPVKRCFDCITKRRYPKLF